MAIFGPKPWVNLLEKMLIIRLFELLVFIAKKGDFRSRISLKTYSGLYWLEKKVGKMAIFGPKPWVNPLGKMSFFLNFWTSCVYSLERRFFVLEYCKRLFPGLYYLKKKLGKMAIFGPKLWVNPFGNMLIFSNFWTSCFYSLERRFFCSRIL